MTDEQDGNSVRSALALPVTSRMATALSLRPMPGSTFFAEAPLNLI
jgi:hypothetical protein